MKPFSTDPLRIFDAINEVYAGDTEYIYKGIVESVINNSNKKLAVIFIKNEDLDAIIPFKLEQKIRSTFIKELEKNLIKYEFYELLEQLKKSNSNN